MWKTRISSPVGELQAFASEHGLRGLLWPASDVEQFAVEAKCVDPLDLSLFSELAKQLGEYFAGTRRQFDLALDPVGTEFQQSCWDALREIPYGETRSYIEQATNIGRPTAFRAVGAANGKNPISIVIPCHRVIGANGSLTGFAGGIDVKRILLEHESQRSLSKRFPMIESAN